MKRIALAVPAILLSVSVASVSWAGGAGCSGTSEAGAFQKASAGKACPAVQKASAGDRCAVSHQVELTGGDHCMMKGTQEAGEACGVKANQAMYSFAVPGAYCGSCAASIQKALMQMKDVACAHVDVDNHMAYIIASKNVDKRTITKAIQEAGFRSSYKAKGSKVEAEFAKLMASASKDGSFCCAKKERDKV